MPEEKPSKRPVTAATMKALERKKKAQYPCCIIIPFDIIGFVNMSTAFPSNGMFLLLPVFALLLSFTIH